MTQNSTQWESQTFAEEERVRVQQVSEDKTKNVLVGFLQADMMSEAAEREKKEKYREPLLSVATLAQICVDICSSLAT